MSKTGGNTGTISYSPGRLIRIRKERAREYARWAALCGPVEVRQLTPEEMEQRKPVTPQRPARTRVSSRS